MTHPLVVHVIPSLDSGGAEGMLTSLVTAKRQHTYPQAVISLIREGLYAETIQKAGVPVYYAGLTKINLPVAVFRLASLIRQLSPMVIQSWLYYGDLITTMALYLSGRRHQTQFYWGVRSSDISREFNARSRFVVAACVRLSTLPDAVVANSYSGRTDHQRIGYRPPVFEVIPNGIDIARYRPSSADRTRIRTELGISETKPLVAHVARVNPMKGHSILMQVAARMPDVQFVAIGRDTENLEAPPNMLRLGVRQDMAAIYAAADLVLSTSLFGEGFSNVIAEAMACGIPAVATDVGDAREIVGDTGLVVPPKSVEALVDSLRQLLREPAGQRQHRAHACRERIVTRFSLERAVTAFDAIYRGGGIGTAL